MIERLEPRTLLSSEFPDTTFSGDGFASAKTPFRDPTIAQDAVVQPDGKFLIASGLSGNTSHIGLMRFDVAGNLDQTFGSNGEVAFPTGVVGSVALQSDGKILAAAAESPNAIRIYRLNADGSADLTYGTNGSTTVAMAATATPEDLVVDTNGDAVTVGTTGTSFFALRLTPGGQLDSTFSGDGIQTIDATNNVTGAARSAALQTDGKIVIGGYTGATAKFVLARLTTAGALDSTFGSNGVLLSSTAGTITGVVAQSDGKILVSGRQNGTAPTRILFARYLTNGAADTTFGTSGVAQISVGGQAAWANALVPQSDGKVVATGGIGSQFGMVRITSGGVLDTYSQFDLATTSEDGTAVAIDSAGRILAAGNTVEAGGAVAAMRFTSAFAPDLAFGAGGSVTNWTLSYAFTNSEAKAAALQPDGKLVVVGNGGRGQSPQVTVAGIALTRFNADGSLDTSFGDGGVAIDPYQKFTQGNASVAIRSDGKIIVAGESYIYRYLPSGQLDTSFDGDGVIRIAVVAHRVLIQPDEKMIVAGEGLNLARYNADGSIDTTFGANGIIPYRPNSPIDGDAALMPDGRIVATGAARVARFTANGQPDPTFSGDGETPGGGYGVAPGDDGSIYTVTGQNGYIVKHYLLDGTLDPNFGTGGSVTATFGFQTQVPQSVAIDPLGKIVVTGILDTDSGGYYSASGLLRLQPDGLPDSSFGTNGKQIFSATATTPCAAEDVVVAADGSIFAVGFVGTRIGFADAQTDLAALKLVQTDHQRPTVVDAALNVGLITNPRLDFTFSEEVVASLSSGEASVTELQNGSTVDITGRQFTGATASFSLPTNLADGNYRATLPGGAISDAAGNTLAADYTFDFFMLAADGDHNRKVDIEDFNLLAANFGKSNQTFSQGNYNFSSDGKITIEDFNILAANFGKHLSPPTASASFQAISFGITPTRPLAPARQGDATDLLTESGLI
jgi:uncharacterized delta-60 repeat protein